MFTRRRRLRRLPSPRLPKIGAAGLLGPELAATAASGGQAVGRPQSARPRPRASSCSGSPAARPPSTCGTSSPKPPRASAASSSRSTPTAKGMQISRAPAEDGRGRGQDHHRPLAVPHHPVARPATVFMTTGNKPTPALQYPVAGLAVPRSCCSVAKGVPPYVTFSDLRNGAAGSAGYLGTAYNPFVVEGSAAARATAATLQRPRHHAAQRLHARRAGEPRQAAAQASTAASTELDASRRPRRRPRRLPPAGPRNPALRHDQEGVRPGRGEGSRPRVATATTPFGQGALAARRLVEAGVRFVTISLGGWDTHGQNFNALQDASCCRTWTRRSRP